MGVRGVVGSEGGAWIVEARRRSRLDVLRKIGTVRAAARDIIIRTDASTTWILDLRNYVPASTENII